MSSRKAAFTSNNNKTLSGSRYSARGVALCLSFVLAACSNNPMRDDLSDSRVETLENLRIAAVGDIMLGSDYPDDRLPAENVRLLEAMAADLQQADITFGNLEGTLLDGGKPVKQCSSPTSCYLFRSPGRFVSQLTSAGFNVLGLANNHARDFGEVGRDSSMALLAEAGIAHTGQDGDVAILEVKGQQVAVIAFAPFKGANDMLDIDKAREQIQQLSRTYNIVLVSFHGGAEGEDRMRIPFAHEFFHGEDRGDVVEFAHTAIDAGADLVIGHGPHVPRAIELYEDRLIAYSLGNFATHWGINIRGNNGIAPLLQVDIDTNGHFLGGKIISAKQQRDVGTLPDSSFTAANLIADLTKADFPHTPLLIDQRGVISISTPSISSGSSPGGSYAKGIVPLAKAD
jgi:poly-gamma-glutamate capsule biosynthesis protein CapA/YwtB (metallophosphatase superfamily)